MAALDIIFKAYDIRGIYPDEIDAGAAGAIGYAFAQFAGARRVLVGRDMRPSGPELVDAFAGGIMAAGADVVDLGLISTDTLYYAAGRHDAPGAVFTASHNPAQYNGIKLCLPGAKPVGEDSGLVDIKAMAQQGVPDDAPGGGTRSTLDVLAEYAAHVRSFIDVGSLRPFKVIADTANGMGGLVVPLVFEGLPMDLEILYPELDGTFPNHPADPINPANLVDLQARVRATGADIGLAFDGDADRVFLIDELGEPVSGSTTTAMLAAAILDHHPGGTVIYNCICAKAVPEVIREHGGTAVRSRVGHSFIKTVMAETDAVFGGEHSAHYYFRDNYRADSGLIAAMIVLEILTRTDQPLSEIRKPYERYAASGEINTKVADPHAIIARVADAFSAGEQDRLDGLTVDFGDWWFNLRSSNTEPLLRLNLEAPNPEECQARVDEVLAIMKEG